MGLEGIKHTLAQLAFLAALSITASAPCWISGKNYSAAVNGHEPVISVTRDISRIYCFDFDNDGVLDHMKFDSYGEGVRTSTGLMPFMTAYINLQREYTNQRR